MVGLNLGEKSLRRSRPLSRDRVRGTEELAEGLELRLEKLGLGIW